jgi:hypothetical protein
MGGKGVSLLISISDIRGNVVLIFYKDEIPVLWSYKFLSLQGMLSNIYAYHDLYWTFTLVLDNLMYFVKSTVRQNKGMTS